MLSFSLPILDKQRLFWGWGLFKVTSISWLKNTDSALNCIVEGKQPSSFSVFFCEIVTYITCAEGHFLCAHISVLILVIWNKCYSPSLLIFWCLESGGGDGVVARDRHRQGTGHFIFRLFLPQVFIESLLCPRQYTPLSLHSWNFHCVEWDRW